MSRVKGIEIDLDMCNSCRMCVDTCYLDVLRWDDKEEKPIAAYPEDCVWCFACELICPVQCIEVIPIMPSTMPASY